jgi:hypothetical protein
MACTLLDLLGLGYSGYAVVDGIYLPLLASSVVEQENLIKSNSPVSSFDRLSAGQIPVLDRRQLKVSLKTVLTQATVNLIARSTFEFRGDETLAYPQSMTVVIANGEGYTTVEGYCESCTINSQTNSLCMASLEYVVWVWDDLYGNAPQRSQAAYLPFGDPYYQPLPHWAVCVSHSGQSGSCLGFDLSLKNNYHFGQLLEVNSQAPNPRVVSPGPLDVTFSYKTLAQANMRPDTTGTAQIRFGCKKSGPVDSQPKFSYNFPLFYRDPSRSLSGLGEADGVVGWEVVWSLIGDMPQKLIYG